jgi:hypothetical protein
MTELVQPLAAAPAEATAPQHAPTFTELVYAHFGWWHALQAGREPDTRFPRLRALFEQHQGQIVHAFWCSHVESAVALTQVPRHHRWSRRRLAFHRESDWATKDHPEIAAALHTCDDLAVRAQTVLTGVRQRICLHLITASAAHLLSLVDAASEHVDEKATAHALAREERALAQTERYYRHAANGQAQIWYFAGMAVVAVVIAAGSGLTLIFNDWTAAIAALIAGSAGAVVSVVQRINAGDFSLEYDVGRPYAIFLGGLRPLIGAAFALALSFAFTSGMVHLPVGDPSERNARLGILVVSFAAGFSERWAQDTLATATGQQKPKPEVKK